MVSIPALAVVSCRLVRSARAGDTLTPLGQRVNRPYFHFQFISSNSQFNFRHPLFDEAAFHWQCSSAIRYLPSSAAIVRSSQDPPEGGPRSLAKWKRPRATKKKKSQATTLCEPQAGGMKRERDGMIVVLCYMAGESGKCPWHTHTHTNPEWGTCKKKGQHFIPGSCLLCFAVSRRVPGWPSRGWLILWLFGKRERESELVRFRNAMSGVGLLFLDLLLYCNRHF